MICYISASQASGILNSNASFKDFIFCPLAVVVTCPSLENPVNGTVDVSGNQTGDTAVYSCDFGFIPDGEATRTCGEDGQWSGSEPTCICKLYVVYFLIVFW